MNKRLLEKIIAYATLFAFLAFCAYAFYKAEQLDKQENVILIKDEDCN